MLKQVRCFLSFRIYFDKYTSVVFFWLLGVIIGVCVTAVSPASAISLYDFLESSSASVIWLIVSASLPFLLVALAVSMGAEWILPFLITCNAFCFAYPAFLFFYGFGHAGWLLQPLLLFTQMCMAPLFCWFVLRNFGRGNTLCRDLLICLVASVSLSVFDDCVISPFLANILQF